MRFIKIVDCRDTQVAIFKAKEHNVPLCFLITVIGQQRFEAFKKFTTEADRDKFFDEFGVLNSAHLDWRNDIDKMIVKIGKEKVRAALLHDNENTIEFDPKTFNPALYDGLKKHLKK